MISVMFVNNETGVINDVKKLVETVRAFEKNLVSPRNSEMNRILIHTDAAQAIGKIRVDVSELGVDYLTVVGHKIYGPRIGALYAKSPSKCTPVYPVVHGADQEGGFRPGNSPVLSAMGMSPENMSTSLRFSVGRETNYSHIDIFVKTYWDVVLSIVKSEV
ncbi:Selenocysteine lyase [Smittium culicis]|uniref:Selenocysteine lyase n=1 Tax=Smittium culicis TaxID=133412 RepID=A0A1R1XNM8_9FUNG|nr:Selenocysteine lyase [Smittium culicis]